MEKLKPVRFLSSGSHPVELEGLVHFVEGDGQWPAAVVCHPHPLGGGSMHNGVAIALARSLSAKGVMALRFNFRGVGRSGGQHDGGQGERADVSGALDWLLAQPNVDPWRVSLVGYSFGAWVGLTHAQHDARVAAVAAVGLVAWRTDVDFSKATSVGGVAAWQFDVDFLQSFTRPKLIVTGEHDTFAPPGKLQRLVDRLPPPKEFHVVRGSDHFLQGREQEVGDLVAGFVAAL